MGNGVIVVTGGCGFIGSHLVRRLAAAGRRVLVIDDLSNGDSARLPSGVEFRRDDVRDPQSVRSAVAGASEVFHLAAVASVAQSNRSWLASHLTNSGGSVAVMEAIRDLAPEASFVYASSAAVYGNPALAAGQKIGEDTATVPLAPYGVDKLNTERHASVAGSLFSLRSFGLRFFNVFGPGQDPNSPYSGVISRFVDQAGSGGPITVFGDGEQSRDFIHVDDVVSSLVAAMDAASVEAPVANICSGVSFTINDLASLVARQFAPEPRIAHGDSRAGDIRRSVGDPSLAARLLGWSPRISLADGLAELIEADRSVVR